MLLLNVGYAPLFLHNELRIVPTLAEASTWERDGKTVKMKRATDAEIPQQAYSVTAYTNMVGGGRWMPMEAGTSYHPDGRSHLP